jgi:serralysin
MSIGRRAAAPAPVVAARGSGDARVDGLLSGTMWDGPLTWRDTDTWLDYGSGYDSDDDGDGLSAQRDRMEALTPLQFAVVEGIFGDGDDPAGFSVECFTRLELSYELLDEAAADLRIANSDDAATAYAYLPGSGEYGGDVWIGGSGREPVVGNYDYSTLLHELGHALGLKHPHEGGGLGRVPAAYDSLEFTVMSYRSYVGAPLDGYATEEWGEPQSYMMLDIAALQQMYGADFSVNAGATTYCWRPGSGRTWVDGEVAIEPGANRIFATIWDGGGKDTYDLSAYAADLRMDLRPGQHSTFARGQLADLDIFRNGGAARGNIFNALQFEGDARSLIECAVGGRGDDAIRGNAAANRLEGGAGGDRLQGDAGRDTLVGCGGADLFVFGSARDSRPGAADRIAAGGGVGAFEGAGRAWGDALDLRGIDADAVRNGNQAFALDGGQGRGRLWLEEQGDVTWVRGNTDGDTAAEFVLAILDGGVRAAGYSAGDFLL